MRRLFHCLREMPTASGWPKWLDNPATRVVTDDAGCWSVGRGWGVTLPIPDLKREDITMRKSTWKGKFAENNGFAPPSK